MIRTNLFAFLFFLMISNLFSSGFYVSPGLQIGLNNKGKLFYSAQITTGRVFISEGNVFVPGKTYGFRNIYNSSEQEPIKYIDAQISTLYGGYPFNGGIGLGTVYDKNFKVNPKFKVWGGFLALASYDYFKSSAGNHHFGLFCVVPMWSEIINKVGHSIIG